MECILNKNYLHPALWKRNFDAFRQAWCSIVLMQLPSRSRIDNMETFNPPQNPTDTLQYCCTDAMELIFNGRISRHGVEKGNIEASTAAVRRMQFLPKTKD
jgi:hypothetical protein